MQVSANPDSPGWKMMPFPPKQENKLNTSQEQNRSQQNRRLFTADNDDDNKHSAKKNNDQITPRSGILSRVYKFLTSQNFDETWAYTCNFQKAVS